MLEMPAPWDTCREELLIGSGTSPRERSVLQSMKLKGVGGSEEYFDIRHGAVKFEVCPSGFQLCSDPIFPPCAPLPPFGTLMNILCHCMLEVC